MSQPRRDLAPRARKARSARAVPVGYGWIEVEARCANGEILWVRRLEDQGTPRLKGTNREIEKLQNIVNRQVLYEVEGRHRRQRPLRDRL